ncbi:MAG: hypothetical protein NWE89_00075 [Candidatus Bathyarchaeota archaeon]|nr:hypothetical protein [Candidatus Bathyarchaeota archaeon]
MTLKSMEIRQMIALDYTLFPLKFHEIMKSLEKIGFELAPSLPMPMPYGRFSGSGQVGRKGKTVCVVNSSDKSIQMVGESIESTSDELHELIVTISDSYKIDLNERVKWYEYQAKHEFKTKKNAVLKINSKFNNPMAQEISKIMDINVRPIIARLGMENEYPNQIEWFDVKISPDFSRNDGYLIETIFRTEDKEKYQHFVANTKIKIEKIIEKIEE